MVRPVKTGTPVDLIMSTDVVRISASSSVSDATKLIKDSGVHKVLVTQGDDVKGILEDWKILPSDETKKVQDIQLSMVPTTKLGSDVGDVLGQLKDSPAVVVIKPNKEIAGVVTAMDLLKLKKSWADSESLTS